MSAKEELKKIGMDLLSGLRFGLGGFPSIFATPKKKTRNRGKEKKSKRR